MAVEHDDNDRLDCGRTVDEVWARVDGPPDQHTRNCEACTAARANLLRLDEAVQAVTAADGPEPEPGVKARIMEVARREARRGRRIPLEVSTDDPTGIELSERSDDLAITEQAVIEVARRAADGLGDLRARRISVVRSDDAMAPPPPARPTSVVVRIRMTVRAGAAIPAAADALRGAVRKAVLARTGLHTASVDVDVEDVHDA
ncbi:MAG: hypothetical protein L0G99_17230 [Propionibacteriales bacterium]|nr:hypothetical protein [Propionibacteriales bacterium]